MNPVKNIKDGKLTSSIGIIIGLLGFSGVHVDPTELAHLKVFIEQNATSLAIIVGSLWALISPDPKDEVKPAPKEEE